MVRRADHGGSRQVSGPGATANQLWPPPFIAEGHIGQSPRRKGGKHLQALPLDKLECFDRDGVWSWHSDGELLGLHSGTR